MQTFTSPARSEWKKLLARPVIDATALEQKVTAILAAVKTGGDAAVKLYTKQFDGIDLDDITVSEREMAAAEKGIPVELKIAIQQAAANITLFHEKQVSPVEIIETMPGVQCWRKSVAIEKVGLYIPGGTAPLFSTLLMLAIPAIIAGCKEIILCTPPLPYTGGRGIRLRYTLLFYLQQKRWALQKFLKLAACRPLLLWHMERKQYRRYIKSLGRATSM